MLKAKAKMTEVREAASTKREAAITEREAGFERKRASAESAIAEREAAVAAPEAVLDEQDRQEALAAIRTPVQEVRQEAVGASIRFTLGRGAIPVHSATVLRADPIWNGSEPSGEADSEGHARQPNQGLQVRTRWEDRRELLTTSGEERGAVGAEDKRKLLTPEQVATPHAFINSEHENGKQVFGSTVAEWIKKECNYDMSNRAVGKLLYTLCFRRRRGRIKIPTLTERKARIRRFIVESPY